MSQLDDLFDRLFAMHSEISGVTAKETPPPVLGASFPLLYPILTGYRETYVTDKRLEVTYLVDVELLVAPFNQNVLMSSVSKLIDDSKTKIEAVMTYYNAHRDLSTSSLDPLAYVLPYRSLAITHDGWTTFTPTVDNGTAYAGTIFHLEIHMSQEVT